jgi:putative ABC transport system substrate-binding protein
MMRRRDLIAVAAVAATGGAAMIRPDFSMAQRTDRMMRVGVLNGGADDATGQAAIAAFVQSLAKLGWIEHRTIEIDYRWGNGSAERVANQAQELVGLVPDAIVGTGFTAPALSKATTRIPVVFVLLSDTAVLNFVESFARPGRNMTGFTSNEGSLVGKRLEMLKEMSPSITRVLYIRSTTAAAGLLFQQLASDSLRFGLTVLDGPGVSDADIKSAVASLAGEPNGGLIIAFDAFTTAYSEKIVEMAGLYRLPAVYPFGFSARRGGLLSYGVDQTEQFRQAASYVDRILKGEKPADLPVQQPTKFELVINLKTAKALGLTVPQTLLVAADEVIE